MKRWLLALALLITLGITSQASAGYGCRPHAAYYYGGAYAYRPYVAYYAPPPVVYYRRPILYPAPVFVAPVPAPVYGYGYYRGPALYYW